MADNAEIIARDRKIGTLLVNDAEIIRILSTRRGARIARLLAERSSYPAEIAQKLGVSKQLVYHYVSKMEKSGLIRPVDGMRVRGGQAKIYKMNVDAVSLVLNPRGWKPATARHIPEKLGSFLSPIVSGGRLNGLVVVGSPHPHGPFRAVATDGHYGFQLGLFIGQYAKIGDEFAVRLDVDVRAEKLYEQNMILLGGPGTNIVTSMMNPHLPIKFNESNYWAGIVSPTQVYTYESCGLIAKIPNPFREGCSVIVLAGLRAVGTKAAIMMLTTRYEELLREYDGEDSWAAVVMGIDLDGDGRIDEVELLETT
ncbi:MAG: winged helix-turn-helix transcriptional regulator [Aigarchaeota archaeon]|nr:winged helix-turn-helix transcriptional regulator [Candidatus Pelearchaeum maunauluense]